MAYMLEFTLGPVLIPPKHAYEALKTRAISATADSVHDCLVAWFPLLLAWARWDASALDLDNHPASQSLSVVTIASLSFIHHLIAFIAAWDQSNDGKSQPGRLQSPSLRHLPELCGINGLSNREIVYQWGN